MSPRSKFDLSLVPEKPDLNFETALWHKHIQYVAGIDEAGRGALAGPVSAGAVVLPSDVNDLPDRLRGVRDSKAMTPGERDRWAVEIKKFAISWGVGFASASEIDQLGIVSATLLAMSRALGQLSCLVEHLLVDFLALPEVKIPQTPLIKGDARSLSIASAAILAKTSRDAILVKMNDDYPGYFFATNKGYGTEKHRDAIAMLGPCQQHRKTFSPIREYYSLFPPES